MKIAYFILTKIFLLIALLQVNAQTRRAAPKYVITFNSFGKVKVGMTVSELSKALGDDLVTIPEQSDCRYYQARRGFVKAGFMVNKGTVARFDVSERGTATDRGAQVGDSEARIKRLYKGQYKVSKHFYTDGNYIEIEMKGGNYSIIFETDGKRVTYIRAGRSPEVGYVEGCS